MKLPRLITRRRLKWAGLAASLLFAAVMVASIWISLEVVKVQPRWSLTGAVSGTRMGGVLWLWDGDEFTAPQTRLRLVKRAPRMHLVFQWFHWKTGRLQAPPSGLALPAYAEFSVPLWFPLLLIAAPTVWLWYKDRRAKPWQCATCRYDLRGLNVRSQSEPTGNVRSESGPTKNVRSESGPTRGNGVCPECGTPIERTG